MSLVVLQVDEMDMPIGVMEKQEAHMKGVLHRAFSVFLFRRKGAGLEILLQQRALKKYHSGGLWTNTCCSHAELNVPVKETAQKRMREEMGFSCELRFAGSFRYKAEVGNGLIENEIDHVFVGFHDPVTIELNPDEAEACQWEEVGQVQKQVTEKPSTFTAWFPEAFELALESLSILK